MGEKILVPGNKYEICITIRTRNPFTNRMERNTVQYKLFFVYWLEKLSMEYKRSLKFNIIKFLISIKLN